MLLEARHPVEWTDWAELPQGNARLQAALVQARRTIVRSQQVLKQAKALQAIYEEPLSDRSARTAESSTVE